MTIHRHGDVLLVPVALPGDAIPVPPAARGVVLAEGEVTGHAHVMPAETVQMWSVGDQRYITVREPSALTHEEHATQVIAPGDYRVIIQREYTPEGIRNVAD
jgi:hypothetical protein